MLEAFEPQLPTVLPRPLARMLWALGVLGVRSPRFLAAAGRAIVTRQLLFGSPQVRSCREAARKLPGRRWDSSAGMQQSMGGFACVAAAMVMRACACARVSLARRSWPT